MIYTTPTGQQIVIPDDMNLGLTAAPMGVNPPLPTMPLGAPPALEAPAPPDVTAFQPGAGPLGAPNPLEGPAPVAQPDFKAPPIAPAKPGKPAPAPKPPTAEQRIEQAGADQASLQARQAGIAREQGALESAHAAAGAEIERKGLVEADIARETAAAVQAEREKGTQEKRSQYDAMVKQEAETKVDQSGGWKNATTGRRVLAGISVALSGLSDVLMKRTGPNAAMQIIKGAVDDDIAAQVREREAAGKRIGYARNSLDDYRRETGEIMDAHKLKLSEGYDRTAQQIRVTASQYGSDAAKLRGEQIATGFEQQAAQLRQQTAEGAWNREVKKKELANQSAQVGIAAGNLKLSRESFEWGKRKEILELQAKADALSSDFVGGNVRQEVVDGKPVVRVEPMVTQDGKTWRPDKDIKKEIVSQRASVQALHDTLGKVKELRARVGGASGKTSPADQAAYDTLVEQSIDVYGKAIGINMTDKGSRESARASLFGDDPSKFHTSDVDKRIDQTLTQIDSNFNTTLQGYGVQPIKFYDFKSQEAVTTPQEQAVKNALETSALDSPENRRGGYGFSDIIKESPAVRVMSEVKQRVAPNDPSGLNQISRSKEDEAALPALTQTMEANAAMARSSNPSIAEQGRKNLLSIASTARSSGVRDLALQYIHRIGLPEQAPKK